MTTLTDFILQRVAEDEAVAREAIDPARPGEHWRWEAPDATDDPDAQLWLRTAEEFATTSGVGPLPAFPLGFEFKAEPSRGMAHIARHDPARVLAECEAKRRIVGLHVCACPDPTCGDCGECSGLHHADPTPAPCDTLRLLALPYADHEDYDEGWRP